MNERKGGNERMRSRNEMRSRNVRRGVGMRGEEGGGVGGVGVKVTGW
jgi:hypothetical protein